MKYECATHSKSHGASDASMNARLPPRIVTQLIRYVSNVALSRSSVLSCVCVSVSPLELSPPACNLPASHRTAPHRTHLDLPDEADTAQRNRSQPTVNTSSYIHLSTVRSLPYFNSHHSTGSSPSLDRTDSRERNATECSVVAVARTRPENPTRHCVPPNNPNNPTPAIVAAPYTPFHPLHHERRRTLSRFAVGPTDSLESVHRCTNRRGRHRRPPAHTPCQQQVVQPIRTLWIPSMERHACRVDSVTGPSCPDMQPHTAQGSQRSNTTRVA